MDSRLKIFYLHNSDSIRSSFYHFQLHDETHEKYLYTYIILILIIIYNLVLFFDF